MKIQLPQRTAIADIKKIIDILGPKVMGMSILDAKKIDSSLFETSNIDACVFLGLLDHEKTKIKLTTVGRDYFKETKDSRKWEIIRERLRQISIFDRTIEYFYHNNNFKPTKVDIASYWNDNFSSELEGITEDSLTNAAIFFLKFLDWADIGKYIQAGRGRETHAQLDKVKIAEYITSVSATEETIKKYEEEISKQTEEQKSEDTSEQTQPPSTALSGSNLRALAKLSLELTEKELDSPGAKKLILDNIYRLERDNTILKAKVDTLQDVDKKAAVLETQINTLSKLNLLKTSVNSIGGIILGMSITLDDLLNRGVLSILGISLVVISIVLREKKEEVLIED